MLTDEHKNVARVSLLDCLPACLPVRLPAWVAPCFQTSAAARPLGHACLLSFPVYHLHNPPCVLRFSSFLTTRLRQVSRLGVTSVLVDTRSGVSLESLERGLRAYSDARGGGGGSGDGVWT